MSDNYLRLVPSDPSWRPGDAAVAASLSIVRSLLPAADSVDFEGKDGVTFFDAGSNTESIACPYCGSDLEDWWGAAMDEAYATAFQNLSVTTPCCGRPTSLNDLNYKWLAAFGMCAIAIRNPGVASFGVEQVAAVEQVIGAPLKMIWQHL